MMQDYRRTVAGDLDQILRCVGFGCFEERHHHLIDIRLQRRQVGATILKPRSVQNRVSDLARLLTG